MAALDGIMCAAIAVMEFGIGQMVLEADIQTMVRRWVNDLARLTGWHITMIFEDLVADFAYHTFGDAKESDWARIEDWFQTRLEEARKRR